MGFLAWILLGLFAGTIAQALVPGHAEPRGCVGSTAIGILGALIGGYLATRLGIGKLRHFFDLETWLVAIAGSALLLIIVRMLSGGSRRR
ncbi:MAG: hypothetical protein QOJ01_1675 [Solirubrobacterales bacterium]|nr:hypothetical protein [Solirubrobacterales bacterium]